MAPIKGGLTAANSKDTSQLPCGLAFTGSYSSLFCLRELEPSTQIHTRELESFGDAPTATGQDTAAWPTTIQEAIHDQRTWIALVLGLLALISIVSLCYQYYKGLIKSCTRRTRKTAAGSDTGEAGIVLPSTPRADSCEKFKQRKERRAAEQRAQSQQEKVTRASGGIQTPGVVVKETELRGSGRNHENSLDEARSLSLQDSDFPLREQDLHVGL